MTGARANGRTGDHHAIQAVTFDFWNTIAYEPPGGSLTARRIDAWTGVLREAGLAAEPERIGRVFRDAWGQFGSRWAAGDGFHAADAARWAVDRLGVGASEEVRCSLVEAFLAAAEGAELAFAEGIEESLRGLKSRGIRLGIVCDVGFTPSRVLRGILARRGILGLFDFMSFSDEVGCYKPSREIFRHALGGLGAAADRAAHVGDLRRTDVAGAIGAGMIAVRYTGLHDDPGEGPEAHHVIGHHSALAPALGLGAR
ncbi:MAG: HAD family hydrolase [Acidobacteria bacterium]|nr:HAD family hydrolase [Acidobacteriota bacterium]